MTTLAAPSSVANKPRKSRGLIKKSFDGLLWVIAALAILACFSTFSFGWGPKQVVSGSMEPTIMTGEWTFNVPANIEDVAVGDVISYDNGQVDVTHRLVADNGDGTFIAQGDGNGTPDTTAVTAQNLRTKAIHVLTPEEEEKLEFVVPSVFYKSEVVDALVDGDWDRFKNIENSVPWGFLTFVAGVALWITVSTVIKLVRLGIRLIRWIKTRRRR
ncbi:signal peptidase I [Microbacterium sp. HMWF026]|uniref:signal peptidase I n=1 Tax=Microbacterium sp. HMWF026 TaxID=2056861 RepID=UPI000D331D0A|nr:signal peptidase I [Microbacterium sp. HMWF026]PTT21705.1 signal peptidase I [Microbacterium sp. HMWF026]